MRSSASVKLVRLARTGYRRRSHWDHRAVRLPEDRLGRGRPTPDPIPALDPNQSRPN